jgi:flagellar biosynthetic protein FliR
MFNQVIQDSQLFLLIVARMAALILTAPILSSTSIPGMARGGLIIFTSTVLLSMVRTMDYVIPSRALDYVMLIILEILIGLIMALMLQIIFSIFQVAGQVFSVQMGFGASTTYDPLAQVETPLIGQIYYLISILVFISVKGLQRIFFTGLYQSFQAIKGWDLLLYPDYVKDMFITALAKLFGQAMIIAFPMMGTLLLISLTMGLLAKAAPQMNLLMIGFPIQITVGFIMIYLSAPFLIRKMEILFDWGFDMILSFLTYFSGGTS